jgi:hypothetical protein
VARKPSASELAKVTEFYQKQVTFYEKDSEAAYKTIEAKPENAAEMAALTMVANVLLNMDEAVTKD